MNRALYAILDKQAKDIIGGFVHMMKHEAVAVRMFADAVNDQRTGFRNHPDDYALVRLGWIIDTGADEAIRLEHDYAEIIDARTILTAQAAAEEARNS